jgi:O-acetylhomoserine (thiol)-lyase
MFTYYIVSIWIRSVKHSLWATRSQLPPGEHLKTGMDPEMVRIPIGIEHAGDTIADLDQALKAAHNVIFSE